MAKACKNSELFYADLCNNRARRRNERPNGKMEGYINSQLSGIPNADFPKMRPIPFINRFTIDDLVRGNIGIEMGIDIAIGFSNLDSDYDSDCDIGADF